MNENKETETTEKDARSRGSVLNALLCDRSRQTTEHEWEEDKDVTALLCTICTSECFDVTQAMVAMGWGYCKSLRVMEKAVALGQAMPVDSENHLCIRFT